MVEHPAVNRRVAGSNPACGANALSRLRAFFFYTMRQRDTMLVRFSPIFVLLFLFIPLRLGAQSPQNEDSSFSRILIRDAGDFFDGIGYVYSAPLRWKGDNWLHVGVAGAAFTGAFLLDDEMRSVVQREKTPFGNSFDEIGFAYGQVKYVLPAAGGVYIVGLISKDEWIRGTGLVLLQTLVSAGGINLIAKPVFGRSRPYLDRGNHDFHFWSWSEDNFSLPSGHAVVAFSLSSVLSARIKNPIATVALYGLAGITAWSRMYSDSHWLSDVVIGGLYTSAIGITLVNRYENSESTMGVRIIPTPLRLAVVVDF